MMKIDFNRVKQYAPIVVRISLSFVFLWFGANQLFFPSDFIGYVPSLLVKSASLIILINGIAEVILGILLLAGFFTRFVALLLSIHLMIIAVSLGYNDIAVRDIGLSLATSSIVIQGADKWCFDFRKTD